MNEGTLRGEVFERSNYCMNCGRMLATKYENFMTTTYCINPKCEEYKDDN